MPKTLDLSGGRYIMVMRITVIAALRKELLCETAGNNGSNLPKIIA